MQIRAAGEKKTPFEKSGSRDKLNRPELEKISSAETTREDMRSRTATKKTEYSRAEQRLPAKRNIGKNFEKRWFGINKVRAKQWKHKTRGAPAEKHLEEE